jgi:hypothetical protein
MTASAAVTTEAPQWPHGQRGEIPGGLSGPADATDTDAPFVVGVQSFVTRNWRAHRSVGVRDNLGICEFESCQPSQPV